MTTSGRVSAWKRLVGHPLRFAAIGGLCLVLAMAVALALLTSRSVARVRQMDLHREHAAVFRRVGESLQDLLRADLDRAPTDTEAYRRLIAGLTDVAAQAEAMSSPQREQIAALDTLVRSSAQFDRARILTALEEVRNLERGERNVEAALLRRMRRDTDREFELALGALIVLPLIVAAAGIVARRRVFRPLEDLRELFLRLANGEFRAVDVARVDPIVLPLFENFNYLVNRLSELEEQHLLHARTLEREVRTATRTLLEQHRSLAASERLAAVGELAAGLAHELRNPLAGIAMSLGNLRRDLDDAEAQARLDPVVAELERITRLLNDHLAAVRHEPEPLRPTNLRALVADLLILVRYQTPEAIGLESRVPETLSCRLPRDRVRQALLNLVLNAVQAMDGGGGAVVVSGWRDGDQIVIEIADDGPGFPEEFVQGGARSFTTHRREGTGLGLAIVRRVVREIGGDLQFMNREGRGGVARLSFTCV